MKRQAVPKSWPIPRKGTAYVIQSNFNPERGVPLLIILRDMLKVARDRREVKKILYDKSVLVNHKIANDEKHGVLLFDKISILPLKKYYELDLSENGKFKLNEIKENETENKITKIIDKKMLKGKKIQINLSDGSNFLSDIKCNINDSVVVNFKHKKMGKCLTLREKARVIVVAGKHIGERGTIRKIKAERKMVAIESKGNDINVLIKQIMVID